MVNVCQVAKSQDGRQSCQTRQITMYLGMQGTSKSIACRMACIRHLCLHTYNVVPQVCIVSHHILQKHEMFYMYLQTVYTSYGYVIIKQGYSEGIVSWGEYLFNFTIFNFSEVGVWVPHKIHTQQYTHKHVAHD